MSRVPASQAGTVAKLFDFGCTGCGKVFETMARQSEIDNREIACPDCGAVSEMRISAPGVDSYAAASWRR